MLLKEIVKKLNDKESEEKKKKGVSFFADFRQSEAETRV